MKITAIECLPCALPTLHRGQVSLLGGLPRKVVELMPIRVTTDEGLVGWGEAFGMFNAWPLARKVIETLIAPVCLGQDALQRTALTARVLEVLRPFGGNGGVHAAWSGIEMALWDLAGKALGVPVHQLLGGAQVDSLACYASLPRYGEVAAVVRECEEALGRGYASVKLHERTVPEIRAAADTLRQAGRTGLMVDTNTPWTLPQALAITRELRDLDLRWLEEPLNPADDYEALARLRAECGIPLAFGEAASGLHDFHTMLRLDAVDYVQPSVAKIGGIAPLVRVANLVADTAVEFAPHSPFFGPAVVAAMHVCAALSPRSSIESYFLDVELDPFAAATKPRKGLLALPQGPGLGCDPDLEVLERCRIR